VVETADALVERADVEIGVFLGREIQRAFACVAHLASRRAGRPDVVVSNGVPGGGAVVAEQVSISGGADEGSLRYTAKSTVPRPARTLRGMPVDDRVRCGRRRSSGGRCSRSCRAAVDVDVGVGGRPNGFADTGRRVVATAEFAPLCPFRRTACAIARHDALARAQGLRGRTAVFRGLLG